MNPLEALKKDSKGKGPAFPDSKMKELERKMADLAMVDVVKAMQSSFVTVVSMLIIVKAVSAVRGTRNEPPNAAARW